MTGKSARNACSPRLGFIRRFWVAFVLTFLLHLPYVRTLAMAPESEEIYDDVAATDVATSTLVKVSQVDELPDFVADVLPIFKDYCFDCHSGDEAQSGFRLDIKSLALKGGDNHGPDIIPGDASNSPLMEMVLSDDESVRMPPDEALAPEFIAVLRKWIESGANWPDGIDEAELTDRTDHWAYKPLRSLTSLSDRSVSGIDTALSSSFNSIDSFITARLEQAAVPFNGTASSQQLIRRLSYDLTGLPPSQDQIDRFTTPENSVDSNMAAYSLLVDELLNSQAYGERYAQHWLDLVRYADTHGFEVNTERPNAWPYRDYVIESLNADTPFDQFIREQIAGDQFGKNAATGFLVSASVLLPGQIGQDDASKRLARQDALDEIINNISQTFLGLSVGCARCHDHKFDPVTAQDYYSMQAFVAGVEYDDRPLTPVPKEKLEKQLQDIAAQAHVLETDLLKSIPEFNSGTARPSTRSDRNIDRFAPVTTKRLRFVVESTNQYEPCIDEFEIYDTSEQNIALKTTGTIFTTSGENKSPNRHDLLFVNDGVYGNSSSWMGNQPDQVWLMAEFSEPKTIVRVEWGRDRLREFRDRTPMAYRIEVQQMDETWVTVAASSDRNEFEKDRFWSISEEFKNLPDGERQAIAPKLDSYQSLISEREKLQNPPKVFAGIFRQPDVTHLLNRGDPEQPLQELGPRFISFLSELRDKKEDWEGGSEIVESRQNVQGNIEIYADELDAMTEAERRRALANWIADPKNPLTPRVIVNRVWQWHFGVGIVPTPSDFGNNGMPPSHPELLDWLSQKFIESGWSLKSLHRLIVSSDAYRRSSQFLPEAARVDGDNRLLWRFSPRRLEAEAIRDSMLTISGELNSERGGPGFDLFNLRGGLTGFKPIEKFESSGLRRMIYAHKVRREFDAVFGAFDCPDGGQSTAVRSKSTTPIQALNLFNSQFTMDRSAALSKLILAQSETETEQIELAFQKILGRNPTRTETEQSLPVVQASGLNTLIRVLFNTNEFLFVE